MKKKLILGGVAALVLVIALAAPLAVMGQSSGTGAVACLDKNGNDLVDIAELFDVIDAYFDGTGWSALCPATAPAPAPGAVDLATTDTADLWIGLSQDSALPDYLQVSASTGFDVKAFDLDIFVDGTEYCNPNTMYADEGWYEMSCALEEKRHTDVARVSVQTSEYPDEFEDLRCGRNDNSTADETIFACVWRSTPTIDRGSTSSP